MSKDSAFMSAALIGMGTLHFAVRDGFEAIVPPQLPGSARFYNYVSGAWEIATGLALGNKKTRRWGGLSACALFAAVWPANFYHAHLDLKDGEATPGKRVYHAVRLPLQVPAMVTAWRIYRRG